MLLLSDITPLKQNTCERCSPPPPPPPRSSPAEETHVCVIKSENWKHKMKGKGVRKSGGRLLPSPTQRRESEISFSASGWLVSWVSRAWTVDYLLAIYNTGGLRKKKNLYPLILILRNAMAVGWFGLIDGISSAKNKRMAATSRRAEKEGLIN